MIYSQSQYSQRWGKLNVRAIPRDFKILFGTLVLTETIRKISHFDVAIIYFDAHHSHKSKMLIRMLVEAMCRTLALLLQFLAYDP